MKKEKIIIGSRGSKLALIYAQSVKNKILETSDLTENQVLIKEIITRGDQVYDKRLSEVGGKGLFSKNIEKELGRKKMPKNSPRECDIDILDYNSKKVTGDINLPHPGIHIRNFVLLPLFELNKNWVHPTSKHHIKTLISSLSNRDIRSIKLI